VDVAAALQVFAEVVGRFGVDILQKSPERSNRCKEHGSADLPELEALAEKDVDSNPADGVDGRFLAAFGYTLKRHSYVGYIECKVETGENSYDLIAAPVAPAPVSSVRFHKSCLAADVGDADGIVDEGNHQNSCEKGFSGKVGELPLGS